MDQPQSGRKSTRSTDASHGLEDASATPPLAIRSGWRHPMALALVSCVGSSPVLLHAAIRCQGAFAPRRARQNSMIESPARGRAGHLEHIQPRSPPVSQREVLQPCSLHGRYRCGQHTPPACRDGAPMLLGEAKGGPRRAMNGHLPSPTSTISSSPPQAAECSPA